MKTTASIILMMAILAGCIMGFSGELAISKPLFDPNASINYSASAQLAARVGDVVTIKIVESMVSKKRRTDKVDKKFTLAAPLSGTISLLEFVNELGLSGQSKHDITRNKDINDSLESTISARVIEIMPNGDLVVLGKRSVAVANDNQIVSIKGIVRPYDLDSSNTVESTKVANLEIQAQDKSKSKGIISKILKFLF